MNKTERTTKLKEWMRQNPEKKISKEDLDELIYVYSDEVNNLVASMIEFYDTAGQSTYGAYLVIGMSEIEAERLCHKVEEQYGIDLMEEY